MTGINFAAVIVAVVAAFAISIVWYIIFGQALTQARAASDSAVAQQNPPLWKMGVELVRSFVLALVIAYFVVQLNIAGWTAALLLAIIIWIGFPLILLSGSVLWENVPWKLAAIHAGDWLVKLLVVALILGIWR